MHLFKLVGLRWAVHVHVHASMHKCTQAHGHLCTTADQKEQYCVCRRLCWLVERVCTRAHMRV